jgi:hypothetical protein
MSNIDLAVVLITIIYGLFLTDLFASLHKLLRNENVKWHWLPSLSAWFVFLIILKNYWSIADGDNQWFNIISFVVYCHLFVLIYLLVASVLPDEVPSNGINLKEYYFTNSRYFWTLMSLVIVGSFVISLFRNSEIGNKLGLINILPSLLLLIMSMSLAIWKVYLLHSIFVTILVLLVLLEMLLRVI